MSNTFKKLSFATLFFVACLSAAAQQKVTLNISVKNHRFQPAEIHAPAKAPIELHVKNLDSSSMEFESDQLHVEKVIGGNSVGIIALQPLPPGRYEFYDDYHQESTGVLVVR